MDIMKKFTKEIKIETGDSLETKIKVEKTEEIELAENGRGVADGGSGDTQISEKSESLKKLLEYGMDPNVAKELEKLFSANLVTYENLDPRALEAIRDFPIDCAIQVLKQLLADSNLQHVNNKCAYICGVMKTFRQKQNLGDNKPGIINCPNEQKIKEILDRTGYSLDVTTGQRKYGGPPPNWTGEQPGAGHEVFIGRIPKSVYEDELIPLFEKCGTIWDLRLMMNPMQGCNRGYGFVTFTTSEAATEAVKQVNNYEIKPNKKLQVNISVANVRLFVGNIPKTKTKEEILEEFKKLTDGLKDVIIYAFPDDKKKKNRGFAFLEYDSHKTASGAKRKLSNGRIRVWGSDIIVDWADPQDEPDDETMSKVKVLYVRNLKSDVTEDELQKLFEPFGSIERVKKVKDYGFIHYNERDSAINALDAMNGYNLHEIEINVTLAKPANEFKSRERRVRRENNPQSGNTYDDYYYGGNYYANNYIPIPPLVRGRGMRGGYFGNRGSVNMNHNYVEDNRNFGNYGGYDDYVGYGYDDFSAEYSPHGLMQTSRGRGNRLMQNQRSMRGHHGGNRGRQMGYNNMGYFGGNQHGRMKNQRGNRGGYMNTQFNVNRGGPSMRGMMPAKRKSASMLGPAVKRRPAPAMTMSQHNDNHFEAQPLAQQPIVQKKEQGDESWYQDSFDQNEWN